MWQEKSIAFFMKNVQELDDKLLKRCKEVERLAVFRDTWDGYNGKAWRVQLRYIDWQGKKRQHTKRGFRSKKEAQEYEREFTAKKSRDINMGFATFVNLYLEEIKPQIRITTYETKIHIVKTHILPYFSEKNLSEIDATDILRWQNEMLQKRDENGGDMSFDVQSRGMIVLHRFNLFKRLESSVFSFEETLRRLLERIERTEQLLVKGSGEVNQEDADFDDSGDDGIYIEGKYEIDVRDLRIDDYLEDLASDKYIIDKIHKNAKKILDEERDKKLLVLKELICKKVQETPYNEGNKKVLVFSAFADTVEYLYKNLAGEMLQYGVYTASVTGKGVKTNNNNIDADFNSVLCAFSPMSKTKKETPTEKQVDLLIGTDCISEGQNLQDYSNICVVGKKETVQVVVDSLQEMEYALKEIVSQLETGGFFLSEAGYEDLKNDLLALCVTCVDILNGAAYLFGKTPEKDNQHWKADLELEQFRKVLEMEQN